MRVSQMGEQERKKGRQSLIWESLGNSGVAVKKELPGKLGKFGILKEKENISVKKRNFRKLFGKNLNRRSHAMIAATLLCQPAGPMEENGAVKTVGVQYRF